MVTSRTIAFREILAATDFSKCSDQASDVALALSQHFGARLHILHVISNASDERVVKGRLHALMTQGAPGVEVVKAVSVGQATSEILKYAERERIDLIVLGTHGRTGLARALRGSVAEAVVREAPCQVLTIGPKAETIEHATAPAQVPAIPASHCLVCAKPSQQMICDLCKAHIQGEAIECKRRDEQAGHRGLAI